MSRVKLPWIPSSKARLAFYPSPNFPANIILYTPLRYLFVFKHGTGVYGPICLHDQTGASINLVWLACLIY